jgi:hypothetical protein
VVEDLQATADGVVQADTVGGASNVAPEATLARLCSEPGAGGWGERWDGWKLCFKWPERWWPEFKQVAWLSFDTSRASSNCIKFWRGLPELRLRRCETHPLVYIYKMPHTGRWMEREQAMLAKGLL